MVFVVPETDSGKGLAGEREDRWVQAEVPGSSEPSGQSQ